jgi:uncharacterized membrane protein
MEKKLYMGIAILSVIAVIVSGLILIQEIGRANAVANTNPLLAGMNNVCTITKSSCEVVQESAYGKTLGIENSYLGIGCFLLLLAMVILQLRFKRRELKAMIILGALISGIMSLRFLYIQAFILGKYCIYCLTVDTLSLLVMALGLMLLVKYGSSKSGQADNKKPAKKRR